MSINHVVISGHLSREPELRTTKAGSVLDFGVAVNDRVKDPATGLWVERPNFFDVSLWGRRAESLAAILRVGAKVTIDGRLRWSQWETPQGKRSRVTVVAEDVELMQQRDPATKPSAASSAPPSAEPGNQWGPDDDIPF